MDYSIINPSAFNKMSFGSLWMVHLRDLTLNPSNIGTLYHSTHDKKFMDNSEIYKRSGQIWPVQFAPDAFSPVQTEITMICSFEHCEVCAVRPKVYEGYGLPFVHSSRDTTYHATAQRIDDEEMSIFAPEDLSIGVDLTVDDIPLGPEEIIAFRHSPNHRYFGVRLRGCVAEVCRVCGFLPEQRIPVNPRAWFARLESDRNAAAAKAAAAAAPPALMPPPAGPNPGTVATPAAPLTVEGGALRMCHFKYLDFKPTAINWKRPGRVSRLVDTYYVPEELPIFRYGGPVHRVTFPDGVRDVMSCTYAVCQLCHRRPKSTPSPSNGEPWVHRRFVTGARNAWNPGVQSEYVVLPEDAELEANIVELDGWVDGVRRTTTCWTCEEGSCEECDDDDDDDDEEEDGEGHADGEDEDGDVEMEE